MEHNMTKTLSFADKYRIILEKDVSYEGIFFTAVKTTGIFCRPSCTARKPKSENVTFYNTVEEALLNGYRPCKVCRPMTPAEETPAYITQILQELADNPFEKIKDHHLRQRNIEPNRLRRWFKTHYGMTFQTYQRLLRINTAYEKITKGESVTHTAYDVGFESLSGFNSSYQTILGQSPTAPPKNIITITRFTTPLGPMFACATSRGLCLLEFTNRRMLESEFKDLCKRLNAVILPGKNLHLNQTQQEITEYFAGKRKTFTVALDTPGTTFQNSVWNLLQTIPYGETRSYQQQAERLGKPTAVRAVASANGYNRISIIIPCHRVIGKDGNLTGYGGGLERKKWLLNFEKSIP
tara:strand:- start:23019 stop:24074 length:1056 start_codon:yes stop_codon:yes gene_type:complete